MSEGASEGYSPTVVNYIYYWLCFVGVHVHVHANTILHVKILCVPL